MKKFYVTTAIPYVNSKPHIGNAMDYMMADVLARYNKQQDADVLFGVGTDEHGTKIAAKAKEQGLDPKTYTDNMIPIWKDFMSRLNVSYTDFVRTTDPSHEQAAKQIWTKLKDYIYKNSYEGWYCVGCEAFITTKEATANDGVCPIHKKSYEKISEENYFFKLSAFGDQIKQALKAGEIKIVPKFREKEILNFIDSGLEDISISRPKKNLSWGIEVPDDTNQVMYVWFEALMNYISVLGYPDSEKYKKFWPADIQIIGKDITRFHAIIWTSMLIALDIPLPRALLIHGFVNVGGTKMSKTIGNVIDPIEIIEKYGVDAMRYYFLRHIPTVEDGDFTWEKFETAYNSELANELGNVVQRVSSMINRYQEGVIGIVPKPKHDAQAFHNEMHKIQLDRALDYIWLKIRELNVYLEEVKPWELAKNPDESQHLQEVLAHSAATLRQVAKLIWPFLPQTSEIITKIFEGDIINKYNGVLFPKIYNHTQDPRNKQKQPQANGTN